MAEFSVQVKQGPHLYNKPSVFSILYTGHIQFPFIQHENESVCVYEKSCVPFKNVVIIICSYVIVIFIAISVHFFLYFHFIMLLSSFINNVTFLFFYGDMVCHHHHHPSIIISLFLCVCKRVCLLSINDPYFTNITPYTHSLLHCVVWSFCDGDEWMANYFHLSLSLSSSCCL